VQGSGCRVEFRIQGSRLRVQGLNSELAIQNAGFRMQGSEYRVWDSGFMVQGPSDG